LSLENEKKRLIRAAQVLSNDSEVVGGQEDVMVCYGRDQEELRYFDIADRSDTMFESIADDGYFYKDQQAASMNGIRIDLQGE